MTEQEARELCARVLERSSADAAQVNVQSGVAGHTRFARNQISTSGAASDTRITATAIFGNRSGSVTTNALSSDGLAEAVTRAEALATFAPEDREWLPLLGPQTYMAGNAFFDSTSQRSDTDRAAAVREITARADQASVVATGFLQQAATATAVANTAGLFAFHRSTQASLTTTVRTADGAGSGWAGTTHNDWDRLVPPSELADQAIRKARDSVDAGAVEPGAYTVVLEPTAVGNLVQLLAANLDARAADEGRSFFTKRGGGNRIGERMIDGRIVLSSDPGDQDLLTTPFTEDGEPIAARTWFENGVLTNLAYSRYWAARQGIASVPAPRGLRLEGAGEGSVDALVQTVERGLLVSRFWYIRPVDRRTLLYTGLTRDGTFLIENGRLAGAVKNLRFNESPLAMLNNVEAIGTPVRVVASESGGLGRATVVPPLVVRDFHFTSVSDAV